MRARTLPVRRVSVISFTGMVVVTLLLTGCPGGNAPTPTLPATATGGPTTALTDTPIPTNTTTPTATVLAATATPAPTATTASTSTVVPTGTPTAQPAPDTIDLHAVDWNAFLAQDSTLEHPEVPDLGNPNLGPYVEHKQGDNVTVGGYALTQNILYTDLTGDSADEAVITLFSGGTAGNIGLLIYGPGPREPALITALDGYKLFAEAEGEQLKVTQPAYGKWDANCCPSGFNETLYRLDGNKLVATASNTEGYPEARLPTVELFYSMLNNKQYLDAYSFLSPAFQATSTFDQWRAGYTDTVSIEAEATENFDGSIAVTLTSVEQTPAGNVTRRYEGAWTLIWSDDASQWLLDEGEFVAIGD